MAGEHVAVLASGVVRSVKNDPTQRILPLQPTLLALASPSLPNSAVKTGSDCNALPVEPARTRRPSTYVGRSCYMGKSGRPAMSQAYTSRKKVRKRDVEYIEVEVSDAV